MSSTTFIKTAFERSAKAISLKPSIGTGTGSSRARIINGLTCEFTEGPWRFVADMPAQAGGNAQGPTPGVYGRGALGSCLAIGYMMYAAKMGVPIESLEVQVEADFNDGALFGVIDDIDPGYSEVRYTVTVVSSAPKEEVMKVIDEGDKHSPYLDVFSRGQKCIRQVQIEKTK